MTAVAIQERPRSVLVAMASRYEMEPTAFEATVRATCIKPDRQGRVASREEFAAFLLVAKEYELNPLTKEIHAFVAQGGGVVPVVGVDGWSSLVNRHPQFDGMEFADHVNEKGDLQAVTCRMYRKDRSRTIETTEYMVECRRDTAVWRQWPRRMLRHKAMIQAARYAFGFSGIYDPDEAERVVDSEPREAARRTPPPPAPIAKIASPPTVPDTAEDAVIETIDEDGVIEQQPTRQPPPPVEGSVDTPAQKTAPAPMDADGPSDLDRLLALVEAAQGEHDVDDLYLSEDVAIMALDAAGRDTFDAACVGRIDALRGGAPSDQTDGDPLTLPPKDRASYKANCIGMIDRARSYQDIVDWWNDAEHKALRNTLAIPNDERKAIIDYADAAKARLDAKAGV